MNRRNDENGKQKRGKRQNMYGSVWGNKHQTHPESDQDFFHYTHFVIRSGRTIHDSWLTKYDGQLKP